MRMNHGLFMFPTQAGADRAVFAIRPGPRDDVQRQLDAILAAVG